MLESLYPRSSDPAFADAGRELMEQTTRTVIYVICTAWLSAQLLLGTLGNDAISIRLGATLVWLGPAALVALRLLPRRLLLAQAVWLVGLGATIGMATLLYRRPEIALLYALLPFVAVVSAGWRLGLVAEAIATLAVLTLARWPGPWTLPQSYGLAAAATGLFMGAVGWASSQSLYTVTEWSLHSFEQARRNMDDARQNRAQLAQVLQDLDRAYYRLERTNAALVAAWRSAADAERFKAELATNLSHELRTPLNLIIGFCEMIVTAPQKYGGVPVPREYRSDLNAIYQNARHLMSLVNDVLDLARIDVGSIALAREHVDIVALVNEAVDMVREYVEAKGIALHVSVPRDMPPLWIDRLRVRQVLLNLLVNAARFTDQGAISVAVTRSHGQAHFSVTDSGRGIPEDHLPHVFEEFGHEAPAIQGWPSTGLGLPISKRYVELHGGQIGVHSTFGVGSTFWFDLPDIAPLAEERQRPRLVASGPYRRVAAHKRVLVVVAPSPMVLASVRRYFASYEVMGARDMDEGVALANDLRAVALLAREQSCPPGLESTIVYVSCAFPDLKNAAMEMGAQDYISKPIAADELWGAIEALGKDPARVLVADDEHDMVRLLRRMLTPRVATADCLEAHTGTEALAIIERERPDLVLLDLMMPEMNGRQVLAEMRRREYLAGIPVILVTAHDPDDVGVRLRSGLTVTRSGGLSLSELVRGVEANLTALAPEWH